MVGHELLVIFLPRSRVTSEKDDLVIAAAGVGRRVFAQCDGATAVAPAASRYEERSAGTRSSSHGRVG